MIAWLWLLVARGDDTRLAQTVAAVVGILAELVNEIRRRPKPSQESVVAQNSVLLAPALLVLIKGALAGGGAGYR